MKFGVKLLDQVNITHFTHIVSTVSKLCSKSATDKSCTLKLTESNMYFILPEFASNNIGNQGSGRTSFWMSIEPKCLFDFYVSESRSNESPEENFIMIEIQPESLFRTLKSSTNIKMVKLKIKI